MCFAARFRDTHQRYVGRCPPAAPSSVMARWRFCRKIAFREFWGVCKSIELLIPDFGFAPKSKLDRNLGIAPSWNTCVSNGAVFGGIQGGGFD